MDRSRETRALAELGAWASLAIAASGCAPPLMAHVDVDGGSDAQVSTIDGGIPASSGSFTHGVGADGVVTTIADATADTTWHYLDLETGTEITTDVPSPSTRWDLAFQRFKVITNGGVSGPGGVSVARLEQTAFASVVRAPESGYLVDAADGEADMDHDADSALTNGSDDWYDYDPATHVLSPKADLTYVVHTGEGHYFKLAIVGYYDGAGTPGYVRFTWAQIEAPGSVTLPDAGPIPDAGVPDAFAPDAAVVIPGDAITIDASAHDVWTYFDVETARTVTPADPETDTSWDLAFSRTLVRTSSGTSGPGLGGARFLPGAIYDEVGETGTLGFAIDEEISDGSPGSTPTSQSPVLGDWYDYDFTTHTVTPKDGVFVVRTASGGYARLRIWRWVDGVYALSVSPIEVRPETVEIAVDASATSAYAYVDLHAGGVVAVTDAATDRTWDLALQRTRIQTSSGTSGPGAGGATDLSLESFAEVEDVPESGYTADATLPDPAPGGTPYSGNPVLAAWYDYDPSTHAVSPHPTVFGVALADGSRGKLQIVSYASGAYVLRWSYAGPGRSTF